MTCGAPGRWLCVMAAGTLLSAAPACRGTSIEPERSVHSVAPSIDVVRVVEQAIDVVLDMPAELDPYEAVAIYPKVSGFVRAISVDRGSRVRAGAVLAELDAPEFLAQRAEAQSKVQGAEALLGAARSKADADSSTFERLRAAAETPGVIAGNDVTLAQKAVETARSQVAAAQQNVEAARQALQSVASLEGYLRITAPFDGVVTERNVHPGALVGPSGGAVSAAPMLRLVKIDRLRLVVPVPEAYVAGAREGTAMAFTVESYPGETFSGAVARIARAVDVKTRTMAVELDVVNPNDRLAPGMFCQVRWPVRRPAPSLLVPSTSVASTTDRLFVVLVRGGRAEWVDVKTGLTSGPLIEVFGDLRAGDFVAARGTDELRPGTPVRGAVP
jgi:membrane fusion protein, multidrug efflux system